MKEDEELSLSDVLDAVKNCSPEAQNELADELEKLLTS